MDYLGCGFLPAFPAVAGVAEGEVNLFGVHKDAFIEATALFICGTLDQETGAERMIDAEGCVVLLLRITSVKGRLEESGANSAGQPGRGRKEIEERHREGGKVECGILDGAIRIEESWSNYSGVRVVVREVDQVAEGARLWNRVGVED